jgi:hypothetical protein
MSHKKRKLGSPIPRTDDQFGQNDIELHPDPGGRELHLLTIYFAQLRAQCTCGWERCITSAKSARERHAIHRNKP